MKRLLATVGVVVTIVGLAGVATGQVPPLPLPTSTTTTTTTTEPPPETTVPPSESTTVSLFEETTSTVPSFDAPPVSLGPTVVPPSTTSTTSASARLLRPVVAVAPVADAVSGTFGLSVAVVLLVAVLLVFLSSRAHPGGLRMTDPRRWRLLAGVAALVLAAIIGLIGWLKLSLEPQVNRQLPYLASAGMALVVLAALGGSLLVAEQLRADDQRIADLEDAVRRLTETLEPIVESPPRTRS